MNDILGSALSKLRYGSQKKEWSTDFTSEECHALLQRVELAEDPATNLELDDECQLAIDRWINDRVSEGRGAVMFATTDSGSVGVFIDTGKGEDESSLGSGATPFEAVRSAIERSAHPCNYCGAKPVTLAQILDGFCDEKCADNFEAENRREPTVEVSDEYKRISAYDVEEEKPVAATCAAKPSENPATVGARLCGDVFLSSPPLLLADARCELPAGHDNVHRDRGLWWREADAEAITADEPQSVDLTLASNEGGWTL